MLPTKTLVTTRPHQIAEPPARSLKTAVGDTPHLNQLTVSSVPQSQPHRIKPENMSISDFYKSHGKKCLTHYTFHLTNAVSILKTGHLAPYGTHDGQLAGVACHADTEFVYFQPESREQSSESIMDHSSSYTNFDGNEWGSTDEVTFVHDLGILDKYHFHTCYMYGELTEQSFSTDPEIITGNTLSDQEVSSEILVRGCVSNDSLIAIWVYKDKKNHFLEAFKRENIVTINGRPLTSLINPEKLYPVQVWQS